MTALRALVGSFAVAVMLSSCGVTADSSPPPTAAELRRALLTADDLGERFTAFTGEGDDDDDENPLGLRGSERCQALVDRVGGQRGGDNDAEATFFTDDGATVFNTYDRRGDGDGDADADVDEVVELIDTCRTLTIDSNDLTGKGQISGGRVDDLGDDGVELRLAFELTEPIEASFEGVLYLWERDDVTSAVIAVDGVDPVSGETIPVGVDQARDWAAIADRRLADVIDG